MCIGIQIGEFLTNLTLFQNLQAISNEIKATLSQVEQQKAAQEQTKEISESAAVADKLFVVAFPSPSSSSDSGTSTEEVANNIIQTQFQQSSYSISNTQQKPAEFAVAAAAVSQQQQQSLATTTAFLEALLSETSEIDTMMHAKVRLFNHLREFAEQVRRLSETSVLDCELHLDTNDGGSHQLTETETRLNEQRITITWTLEVERQSLELEIAGVEHALIPIELERVREK